jgi:hypothetical protein
VQLSESIYKRTWRIVTLLVVGQAAVSLAPQPAAAQDDEAERRLFWSVGVSEFVADFAEDSWFEFGAAARVGLQEPGSEVALALSYWPDVSRFRMVSLQAEFTQNLTGPHVLTPRLTAAVGHTWGKYLDSVGEADEPTGASAAIGVGVRARITRRTALLTDVRLRTDDYGWNAEWRTSAELNSGAVLRSPGDVRVSVLGSWMTRLGGPWVSVEPAFGLMVHNDGSLLSVMMAHWQIPRPASDGGGYSWDTRSLIASAQSERQLVGDKLRWRIGPAIGIMGEGPDSGVRFGWQIDLVLSLPVGPGRVDATAGWLWLRRPDDGPYEGSQDGLVWSVSLGG